MSFDFAADQDFPAWRKPAPRARRLTMSLYSWRDPSTAFLAAVAFAMPFVALAAFSPALLSFSPTLDVIDPIATARAAIGGEAAMASLDAPFWLMLIAAADIFADAPGRIHLVAKAIAAVLALYPLAYAASVRFPVAQAALLTAGVAGYAAAPFSRPADVALAYFAVAAVIFVCPPADEAKDRARFEGLVGGALIAALWFLSPVFSLAAFLALSACPFVTGRGGLDRYLAALVSFGAIAAACEFLVPGLNVARASAASGMFAGGVGAPLGVGGVAGIGVSTAVVIAASAVFGGREHRRAWIAAAAFLAISLICAKIAGASPAPLFGVAAAIACLSVASPFYDGVFRAHDRASIAIAGTTAFLTMFWTASVVLHAAGQFSLQFRTAATAEATIRSEFALVQPGGSTIARWIEEGRFSTPEARELFSIQPVDQSAILLEAATRARTMVREGADVAILTGADSACVIAGMRDCAADGREAAKRANIVFVPRVDLDLASVEMRASSEALLYTQFRLAERTALWEIWVRRGVELSQAGIAAPVK